MEHKIDITVVVPFYKGNAYINELVENVTRTALTLSHQWGASMEILIVNDSPWVPVELTAQTHLPVRILPNEKNLGIHGSRIHGIREARGEYIQLLDQDDLLIPETYPDQFRLAQGQDLTVGNAEYYFGKSKRLIYPNEKVMKYYICGRRFREIRDLIASPGHCLIRREAFPAYWLENPMTVNGADDYYLWMLMFENPGLRLKLNPKPVYIHRNNAEGNLSFDLQRMHASNLEMCDLLAKNPLYPKKHEVVLHRSIVFKYLYDTKQLKPLDWLKYADKVLDNGVYKIYTKVLTLLK